MPRISRLGTFTLVSTLTSVVFTTTSTSLAQGPSDGPRFQDILLHDEFDADNDGRLDRDERDRAREAKAKLPTRGRRGGRGGMRSRPGGADMPRPETSPDSLRLKPGSVTNYPGKSLYDPKTLRTYFFEVEGDDWHEELSAFHGTDVEVPAKLTIDGELIGEVGLSYRGNTSFQHPPKKSFGVSIDAYDDDLRLMGYRTLNLLNANGDDSMMREVLFSNIASDYMPAPKANFAKVVVNGVYLGVYANVQQINKDFTKEHYDSRKGVRWKVPPDFSGGGALVYHSDDIRDYKDRYELKTNSATAEDWQDLIELCRVLRDTPRPELKEAISKRMDVQEVLWFLALDNVFMDSDGYYSRGSDYYVYKDPDGVFHLLHYDNNETFGRGQGPARGGPPPGGGPGGFGPGGGADGRFPPPGPGDMQRDGEHRSRPGLDRPRPRSSQDRQRDRRSRPDAEEDPPRGREADRGRGGRGRGGRGGRGVGINQTPLALSEEVDIRPVIARILSIDEWREQYLQNVRHLAEQELDWEQLGTRIATYRDLIIEDVEADPFLGDRELFIEQLVGPENSLKKNSNDRRTFLLQQEVIKGLSSPDDPL